MAQGYPLCFNSLQGYADWRKTAVRTVQIGACSFAAPCHDCPAGFASRMRADGRCQPALVRRQFSVGEQPEPSQHEEAAHEAGR